MRLNEENNVFSQSLQVSDRRDKKLVAATTIPLSNKVRVLDLFSSSVPLDTMDPEITLEDSEHWAVVASIIDVPKGRVGWIIKSFIYEDDGFGDEGESCFWPSLSGHRLQPIVEGNIIEQDYFIEMMAGWVPVVSGGEVLILRAGIHVVVEHGCGNGVALRGRA